MIDIHTHIAPAMDDGAEDIEEALSILSVAKKNGTTAVVLTPHFPFGAGEACTDAALFLRRVNNAAQSLSAAQDGVRLFVGAEMYCDDSIFSLISQGKVITLASTSYVLIEFPVSCNFSHIKNTVSALVERGYRPVIAHTERYISLQLQTELVGELKAMGCAIQVNAHSITKKSCGYDARLCEYLIKNRLADVVASDTHHTFVRPPDLSAANAETAYLCSTEYADKLFFENPRKILNDMPLD